MSPFNGYTMIPVATRPTQTAGGALAKTRAVGEGGHMTDYEAMSTN